MFDIYWGETNFAEVILIVSVVFILPVQLLLCFKTKRLVTRLLPVILFSAQIPVFLVMALIAEDLTGLLYFVFAIYAAFMLFICGIGWAVWAIINRRQKRALGR